MVRSCSVSGCKSKTNLHRFPNPTIDFERCQAWINFVRKNNLINKSNEQLSSYRVCDLHFSDENKFQHKYRRTNLKPNAVPSLHPAEDQLHQLPIGRTNAVEPDIQEVIVSAPCSPEIISPESLLSSPTVQDQTTPTRTIYRSLTGGRRLANLTPHCRQMLKKLKFLKRKHLSLKRAEILSKETCKNLGPMAGVLNKLKNTISGQASRFGSTQLLEDRRDSRDFKLSCLALHKLSPQMYRSLRWQFILPSPTTLNKILESMTIDVGINANVMLALANTVERMEEDQKTCILMWDEISLKPGLSYNVREDVTQYALVFMVAGLSCRWKQPICYFLTSSGMKSEDLERNIKLVVSALVDIGLNVVATVCDQASANVKAVKDLCEKSKSEALGKGEELRNSVFHVGLKEIVPLWSASHLVKCMRNNLLTKDVVFCDGGIKYKGSWQDLIALYHLESRMPCTLQKTKLTTAHVYPQRIKKMKVKYAVQVLSASVAHELLMASFHRHNTFKYAEGTGRFVQFMDELFDSINGNKITPPFRKPLRCGVQRKSGHMNHWAHAKEVLKTMYFVDGQREMRPPSLKHWIMFLENLEYLCNKLWAQGFTYVMPKNCNHDSLENFFSGIRGNGIRNVNPTAKSFYQAFRSLLLTNLAGVQSSIANCESDSAEGVLNVLRTLLDNGG